MKPLQNDVEKLADFKFKFHEYLEHFEILETLSPRDRCLQIMTGQPTAIGADRMLAPTRLQ